MTNNFNDKDMLGQGGFGVVYKGFLWDSNSFVAVERVSKGSKQRIKEYASKVNIISQLRLKFSTTYWLVSRKKRRTLTCL